jgi:2-haloacid dehalogenase
VVGAGGIGLEVGRLCAALGMVKVIKPEPRIFELLIERFAIDPHRAVYIDDVEANVSAARPFGIHAIHFTTPAALREELVALGLLPSRVA